jgi:proline iminopeptidase
MAVRLIGVCQLIDGPESERRGWRFATPYLLPEVVALNLTTHRQLSVPLVIFLGRHDRNVNAEVAATWFATVQAPEKHLVWFEHSGHLPMTEEPGKFLMSLVQYARTIAEKAGETALEVDRG